MEGADNVFSAIRLGDIVTYREGISNVDINSVNEYGQSFLHEAVAFNRNDIGEDVVARGINILHQDEQGQTVLHYAASHGNAIIAEYILRNGGNANITDVHGNNALWTASFNARGNNTMVELFIKYGADPTNKNLYGKSCIDMALQFDDEELLQILKSEK